MGNEVNGMGTFGIGLATAGVNTGLNMLSEQIAYGRQKKLMGIQRQNQMQLNQQAKDLALQQWHDTNYEAQRAHMEKAGLNPGLMYGIGGGGGTTANAGSGGGASGGNAPMQQQRGMDIAGAAQLAMMQAQIENLKADTNLKNANASGADQKGEETWLNNIITRWKMENDGKPMDAKDVVVKMYKHKRYGAGIGMDETSLAAKELSSKVLQTLAGTDKALADAALTNERVKGYWNELMIAQQNADSNAIEAAARKLASQWSTGEYTNWKTWAELSIQGLNTAGNLIDNVMGGVSKGAKAGLDQVTKDMVNRGKK